MSEFIFLFPSLTTLELTQTQSSVFHFLGLASCYKCTYKYQTLNKQWEKVKALIRNPSQTMKEKPIQHAEQSYEQSKRDSTLARYSKPKEQSFIIRENCKEFRLKPKKEGDWFNPCTSYTFLRSWRRCWGSSSFTTKGLHPSAWVVFGPVNLLIQTFKVKV